jgi:uncharacterized protein (TIGR03067 family)
MFVTALLAASLAAPGPKGVKATGSLLDGMWQKLEQETAGGPLIETELIWEIRGEDLFIRHVGEAQSRSGSYTLVRPAGGDADQVDFVSTGGGVRPRTLPAVFALDGDFLTICLALQGNRPGDCKEGKGRRVLAFKRVPDPSK